MTLKKKVLLLAAVATVGSLLARARPLTVGALALLGRGRSGLGRGASRRGRRCAGLGVAGGRHPGGGPARPGGSPAGDRARCIAALRSARAGVGSRAVGGGRRRDRGRVAGGLGARGLRTGARVRRRRAVRGLGAGRAPALAGLDGLDQVVLAHPGRAANPHARGKSLQLSDLHGRQRAGAPRRRGLKSGGICHEGSFPSFMARARNARAGGDRPTGQNKSRPLGTGARRRRLPKTGAGADRRGHRPWRSPGIGNRRGLRDPP